MRSLKAAVSWLSKSKTGFLTLQLVTFSKDICFFEVDIATHFAAEARRFVDLSKTCFLEYDKK